MKRLPLLALLSITALSVLLAACNTEQPSPFFPEPTVSEVTINGDTITITGDGFFQVEPGSALPGNLTISVCGETVGKLVLNGETKTITFAPGNIATITTATKVIGTLTGEITTEHSGVRVTNPDGRTINVDTDCDGEAPDEVDDEPAPQEPEEPEEPAEPTDPEPEPDPSEDVFQLTIDFTAGDDECEDEECIYVTPDSIDEEAPYMFFLPLTGTGTITIDWGDGETTTTTNPNRPDDEDSILLVHNYADVGPYVITVTGEFIDASMSYDSATSLRNWTIELVRTSNFIVSFDSWGTFQYRTLEASFAFMENLKTAPTYLPGNPTNLSKMFLGAMSFNSDISDWDVSSVEDMGGMFFFARAFNQDIGGWQTGSVTEMTAMFNNAESFNQDLSKWDVSKVENMDMMFGEATSFNTSLADWCVRQIDEAPVGFASGSPLAHDADLNPAWGEECGFALMINVPEHKLFNLNLSGFGTVTIDWGDGTEPEVVNNPHNPQHQFTQPCRCVIRVDGMLTRARFGDGGSHDRYDGQGITALLHWGDFEYVSLAHAFEFERYLQSVPDWLPSDVQYLSSMFAEAERFNQDISTWDTSSVTNMGWMFHDTNFNQDISNWDVRNVTTMRGMFGYNKHFNQPIGNWKIDSLQSIDRMFIGANAFNQDLTNWDTSAVTDMLFTFAYTKVFNGDISTWDTRNVTNMVGMFSGAQSFNGNLSAWCVDQIEELPSDFYAGAPLRDTPAHHPQWGVTCSD